MSKPNFSEAEKSTGAPYIHRPCGHQQVDAREEEVDFSTCVLTGPPPLTLTLTHVSNALGGFIKQRAFASRDDDDDAQGTYG